MKKICEKCKDILLFDEETEDWYCRSCDLQECDECSYYVTEWFWYQERRLCNNCIQDKPLIY